MAEPSLHGCIYGVSRLVILDLAPFLALNQVPLAAGTIVRGDVQLLMSLVNTFELRCRL